MEGIILSSSSENDFLPIRVYVVGSCMLCGLNISLFKKTSTNIIQEGNLFQSR